MVEQVAKELIDVVAAAAAKLSKLDDATAAAKPSPEKWSKKEILGHLIDSASNNHQRFVRAQQVEQLNFPKYEQNEWIRIQDYGDSSWPSLVEFWRLYNLHLAHVIKRIPANKLNVAVHIGPSAPVPLGFVVEDYLVHLKHHLGQLGMSNE